MSQQEKCGHVGNLGSKYKKSGTSFEGVEGDVVKANIRGYWTQELK